MIARKVFAIVGALALAMSALGYPLNYAQRTVRVRAAVVVIDSQQVGGFQADYNPFVWYNLESNRNVKPAGWSFYNPVPPTQVTPPIVARWSALNAAQGSAIVPSLGSSLTKRDAPYWEVFLSQVSDEQLSQFDVLHLSLRGFVQINPLEREKLRRFMEHGGVLWVDVANTYGTLAVDVINGLPLPFNLNTGPTPTGLVADYTHPLLSFPSSVNAVALLAMQSEQLYGLTDVNLAALGFGDLQPLQQPTEAEYSKLLPIATDSLGPFVSLGKVGDGYLAVTTRGVATTLNRTQRLVGGQPVPGAYVPNTLSVAEDPLFDRTSDAAAKLVVNMVHLTSGFEQPSKGARKTRSSNIDIGAPLLKRFNVDIPFGPNAYVPPAVYKGLAVAVTNNQVLVFDADPSRDLNLDGNPDDGLQDLSLGYDYDLVWTSAILSGPISAPTCAEVSGSAFPDQIAVIDGNGQLVVFNANSFPTSTVAPVFQSGPPAGYSPPGGGARPLAPTFYDGMYFVADEGNAGIAGIVGRCWIADATTGTVLTSAGPWVIGGPGVAVMRPPSGSPTVGSIPIRDNSGGVDRVVYIPMRASAGGGPANSAGLTSLWLGAKGEKPSSFQQVGNQLLVVTRASLQGLQIYMPGGPDPLGVKLTVLDPNGNPYDAATMDGWFTNNVAQAGGILTFTMEPSQSLPPGASLRVDYTLDWGTGIPAQTAQIVRGIVTFPDDLNLNRVILNPLALSPEGTLHVVTADPDPLRTGLNGHDGGTYWALREEAKGTFKLVNRYDLYQAHTVTLSQARPLSYAETLFDTDEVQSFMPAFLGGSFQRLRFRSGPAVHNGVTYVTANGFKAGGLVPCTIVMAFTADPGEPMLSVPDISGSFSLVQPDFARSDNKNTPNVFSTLQQSQFRYESGGPGGKAVIRFTSLTPNQRGAMINAISRSQPVIIRRSGQPDLVVEPDRFGAGWSPLLWYIAFHGYNNQSPVLATGNTLFVAANSMLPDIVSGVPFGSWQPRGLLLGLDAVVSPTDTFLHSNPLRPWLKQVWQLDRDVPNPGDVSPNPGIRWPQMKGVTSFEEWRQRLLQTKLGNSNEAFGVSGGDGVLLSWSQIGLWAFSRADIMIADEGRLARFDSSGNPVWTSSSSTATGTETDSGGAGNVKPLVRPTRAYPLNQREMVVVDTAGDRLSILDVSGRELRSISKFRLDPNVTPEGFKTNEPLTFRQPRDVYVYGTYVIGPTAYSNAGPPAPLEYWVHYLIADSGNKRLVELIDRYAADPATRRILDVIVDGTGARALGILNWHSPASLSGKNFQYSGIAAVMDATGSFAGRRLYAACIGSALPTRTGLGLDSPTPTALTESEEGNGGIVLFDNFGSVAQVINEVEVPGIAANVLYNPATGLFDLPAVPPRVKKLGNIRSVTMRFVRGPITDPTEGPLAIMFADSEGVWEIAEDLTTGRWRVRWALPREVYRVLRRTISGNVPLGSNPLEFQPTFARRLDSGEILVVNGYVGKTQGGSDFSGEVLQLIGDINPIPGTQGFAWNKINLGLNSLMISFQLPPVSGARGLIIPVFADRR